MTKFEFFNEFLGVSFGVLFRDDLSNNTLNVLRNSINVLDLNRRLELLFKHFSEISLQLRSSEVLQQFIPIRWAIEFSQVWHFFTCKNLKSSRLTDSVCTD